MSFLLKILARGLSGTAKVCKTFREGFDSLPRLHDKYRMWRFRSRRKMGDLDYWLRIKMSPRSVFHMKDGELLESMDKIWKAWTPRFSSWVDDYDLWATDPVSVMRNAAMSYRERWIEEREKVIFLQKEITKLKRGI